MNRIKKLLSEKKSGLLSVYFTAGFPHLDDTVPIGRWLEEVGADMIEVGIPFSDPIADGPTIQESNKAALDNGITVAKILRQVKSLRSQASLPIILMGYLNPVMQFGVSQFLQEAAAAGVDGVILPDLPLDEYVSSYKDEFDKNGLLHTFLISPTTSEERIRKIDHITDGFIYAVSASSTTGVKDGFTEEQVAYFKRLKEMKLDNPFLVGFGISDHNAFETVCRYGAGAIVGSSFIRVLQKSKEVQKDISDFVSSIKNGATKSLH